MPPVASDVPAIPPRRPRVLAGLVVALLAVALASCGRDSPLGPGPLPNAAPPFLGAWSAYSVRSPFDGLRGLVVTRDGVMLAHDAQAGRILRYDAGGTALPGWFTVTDSSGGQPAGLGRMKLGWDGLVYFDEERYAWGAHYESIVRFTTAGEFRGRMNIFGPDSTRVAELGTYGVDADGALYAIGWSTSFPLHWPGETNSRVHKFAPDGTPLLQWGRRGAGPGEFEDVADLVVAPDGTVLVSDSSLGRVQRFDGAGHLLNTPVEAAPDPYDFYFRGLVVTPAGELLVRHGDGFNRYGLDGAAHAPLTLVEPDGRSFHPEAFGVDADGRVGAWQGYPSILRHFTAAGAQDFEIGTPPDVAPGDFSRIEALAPASGGGVLAYDANFSKLLRMGPGSAAAALAWSRVQGGHDSGLAFHALATDPAGRVLAIDRGGRALFELDAAGAFTPTIAVPPRLWDAVGQCERLVAGAEGRFFALNRYAESPIVAFTAAGTILAGWEDPGPRAGTLRAPLDLALDGLGRLWVLDGERTYYDPPDYVIRRFGPRVQAFDAAARLVASVSLDSAAVGGTFAPQALALDPVGNLVVCGRGDASGVVVTLDPGGRLIGRWGPGLTGDAAIRYPTHVVRDAAGDWYLYDGNMNRLLRYGRAAAEATP